MVCLCEIYFMFGGNSFTHKTIVRHFKNWYTRTDETHDEICIMAYGSTPYVGMTPPKNGGHIESYK